MTKTLINITEQRTVISKFRKVAAAVPGAEYVHERTRKTKVHPFEENSHRLMFHGQKLAEVQTGAVGLAKWDAALAAIIRSV